MQDSSGLVVTVLARLGSMDGGLGGLGRVLGFRFGKVSLCNLNPSAAELGCKPSSQDSSKTARA